MQLRTLEIPQQKYEKSDLTKVDLKWLKRRYELGMVFTAMLSMESDPRSKSAALILAIQMQNIWLEWQARMAAREIQGRPAYEIWQRVPKRHLIAIANKDPRASQRYDRKGKPISSNQIVKLNTLSLRAIRG